MKLKLLIDMNLSPSWVKFFTENNIESVHWSSIGKHNEKDSVILEYADENGYVVFTNDLDLGDILAAKKTKLPSVIQIRSQDVLPSHIGNLVITSLTQHQSMLKRGALISVNEIKQRVRILPIDKE